MRVHERLVRLEFEARVAEVAAAELARGFSLSTDDRERLRVAAARIHEDRAWLAKRLSEYYARVGGCSP